MEKEKKLGSFQICFILVGTILGAGFASGREIWTYFGTFGDKRYPEILLMVVIYAAMCLVAYFSSQLRGTTDFSKVMVPEGSVAGRKIAEKVMPVMIWMVIITMSAAAGSIVSQQFGLPAYVGGLALILAVLVTVMGNFKRVSGVLRFVMPVLLAAMLVTCAAIIMTDIPPQGYTDVPEPSPLAPTWYTSALIYICFNIYGTAPMCMITCARARSRGAAIGGILLNAACVGILAVILSMVNAKDPSFSQAMDLPVLAYSSLVSRPINILFTVVLIAAIYASACSNYYAFTSELAEGRNKNKIIIGGAFLGFAIGLVGFKALVTYLFSVRGLLGIVIFASLLYSFIAKLLSAGGRRKESGGKTQ